LCVEEAAKITVSLTPRFSEVIESSKTLVAVLTASKKPHGWTPTGFENLELVVAWILQ
jgi:hypothetical protein